MEQNRPFLKNVGFCNICNDETIFVSNHHWLRDHYICIRCKSIPRERALMRVLNQFYPNWPNCIIHETSPAERGVSTRLRKECNKYIPSQFFADTPVGSKKDGILCENLEELSFFDSSIDLHISQDVLEHIFHPESAFKEIARTLKPGGAHLFTVPIVNKFQSTSCRATYENGEIIYHEDPIYHGNPIRSEGSLVTFDWGYDIVKLIWNVTGLPTFLIQIDDLSMGIRAEYIDVFVTIKL